MYQTKFAFHSVSDLNENFLSQRQATVQETSLEESLAGSVADSNPGIKTSKLYFKEHPPSYRHNKAEAQKFSEDTASTSLQSTTPMHFLKRAKQQNKL